MDSTDHQSPIHESRQQGRQHQVCTEQPDDTSCSMAVCGLKDAVTKHWRFLIPSCLGRSSPESLPISLSPITVYQVWPGKNVFFLDGRVVFGPDPRGLILTVIAVVLSEWIFLADVVDPSSKHPILIAAFSMALAAAVIATLLLTATRDPGIIPRKWPLPSQEAGTSTVRRTGSWRIVIDGV
nr:probable protein S-acyltransferase 7 [Lolium perenne]